jgi:glycosyltransferase involved in cell wall biosynthesis
VPHKVSLITTIFNERATIEHLLDSLATQQRPPDEIILCDGGSTDGTVAAIAAYQQRYPERLPQLRVIMEQGANISRGRNLAIAAASHPLIAVTDAGVRLTNEWLAALIAPWEAAIADQSAPPLAVAGFFLPDLQGTGKAQTIFLTAMAATVLPLMADIVPHKFLPSSRSVAFTKAAWVQAGGYPEWLDYCEDLIFDLKINAQQPTAPTAFVWAPAATVYFQPRATLHSFWTQYYRYARGDGKADLWRKRHLARYLTYLVALPALLGHALWGSMAPWLGWAGLLVGGIVYCARPWQRVLILGHGLSCAQRLGAFGLVPLIRVVGDLAKMVGYPVGLWWRWRRRGMPGREWRETL